MGRTCCVQKLFLTFRTISVHNMFSPCSPKRRASDKDLPVTDELYSHSVFRQRSFISLQILFIVVYFYYICLFSLSLGTIADREHRKWVEKAVDFGPNNPYSKESLEKRLSKTSMDSGTSTLAR